MVQNRTLYVYLDRSATNEPISVGALSSAVVRGKDVFSFEADSDWIKNNEFRTLDPDLGQFSGPQYLRDEKVNFGLFLDSSPDRWGRMLMQRREELLARTEHRAPRTLRETDYLLGVYDGNRMGALRFKTDPSRSFLDNNRQLATPPWTSIRDLEYASWELERGDGVDSSQYAKWLGMLIAPGSSLGGARPKANVADEHGALWIAKFPSRADSKDVGAWELVANDLAAACGITVAESRAQKFVGDRHTFLSKRFDRTGEGKRIHFASAMTLLGLTDGADGSTGASYLSLAECIMQYGAEVEQNLEELWRRMAFNVAVSNCDDHLRNHGFLLTDRGWVLSPAYDLNPDELGTGLKLNLSEGDNSLDFELVLSVARYFRLSTERARSILSDIRSAVSTWRAMATHHGLSRSEQEQMARAFRY